MTVDTVDCELTWLLTLSTVCCKDCSSFSIHTMAELVLAIPDSFSVPFRRVLLLIITSGCGAVKFQVFLTFGHQSKLFLDVNIFQLVPCRETDYLLLVRLGSRSVRKSVKNVAWVCEGVWEPLPRLILLCMTPQHRLYLLRALATANSSVYDSSTQTVSSESPCHG